MSDIILPPVHNVRSPAQWEIINKHIDVKGKTVLDLGCGHGDILLRCWLEGADCLGVDKERHFWNRDQVPNITLNFIQADIDNELDTLHPADVVICFAILPYLRWPMKVLDWIKNNSRIALIECQYKGDGPGNRWVSSSTWGKACIPGDEEMYWLLDSFGWQSVKNIGKTLVEDRDIYRTIWKCE